MQQSGVFHYGAQSKLWHEANGHLYKFTAVQLRGDPMDRAIPRFIACAAGSAALVFAVSAHAQIPTVNIQATCQAAAGVMLNFKADGGVALNDVELCLESENSAYQQMTKNLPTFQSRDQEGCIQTRAYLPSYAEWLTCFEMNKAVREGRQQQGQTMSNFAIMAPVTLSSVRSLGLMQRY